MDLRNWLKSNGTRQEDFAASLTRSGFPLSQARISQIVRNGTHSLGTALAIQDATGGDVTVTELLGKPKQLGGEAA